MLRVIVTGAQGALGVATANHLQQAGMRVARLHRGVAGQAAVMVAQEGIFTCADLSDAALASETITAAAGWLGGLDALVNIAGGFDWQKIEGGTLEIWQRMFNGNLLTIVSVCLAALPHFDTGGSIVNIGAATAEPAGIGMAAYAASKSGVARLTESLAAELKPRKIRVNAILPSIIDTPRNRADMPKAKHDDWVTPAGIADVIEFLISDRSRCLTGTLIPVTNPS